MHVLHYERADQQFIEAATVKEAIELCKTNPIDVIFVDLHLKDGSGFDLISCIKAPGESSPKIILLASTISIFEFRRAKDLDVEGYLLKEADADDLKYAYSLILRGEKILSCQIGGESIERQRTGRYLPSYQQGVGSAGRTEQGSHEFADRQQPFISEGTAKNM